MKENRRDARNGKRNDESHAMFMGISYTFNGIGFKKKGKEEAKETMS
jgi:hypothetical protein